jgi:hypothetical protein
MTKLLALAAVLEAVTGLAFMIYPTLAVWLLLGESISRPGEVLGRVAGLALLSLGLACWPGANAFRPPAMGAMFAYNLLITAYLLWLGIGSEWVGILLWPAVALHSILTLLLAGLWFKERKTGKL